MKTKRYKKTAKKLGFYFFMSILFSSCAAGYQEIGGLNMLSDRHIDPNAHYQMLATGAGSSKKQIKSTAATNIEQAIDQVLDQVPGGYYLTNVKIYAVNGDYLAVSGDVWGKTAVKTATVQHDSIKVVARAHDKKSKAEVASR